MNKNLSPERKAQLLSLLQHRFQKFAERHPDIDWNKVRERLEYDENKLWSLNEMEETGGEPDVIGYNEQTDRYIFCDCSPESPKGRRSVCYDQEARDSRKEHKPKHSALGMCSEMGIKLLGEDDYRRLQQLGDFDNKTSSWLQTPEEIRKLGGAIFGDRRFGHVFVYHNGAESYYAVRGFRGMLEV